MSKAFVVRTDKNLCSTTAKVKLKTSDTKKASNDRAKTNLCGVVIATFFDYSIRVMKPYLSESALVIQCSPEAGAESKVKM